MRKLKPLVIVRATSLLLLSVGIAQPAAAHAQTGEKSKKAVGVCAEAIQLTKAANEYLDYVVPYRGYTAAALLQMSAVAFIGSASSRMVGVAYQQEAAELRAAVSNPAMTVDQVKTLLAKAAASEGEAATIKSIADWTFVGGAAMAGTGVAIIAPELFVSGTAPDHVKLIRNKEQFIGMALAKPAEFCKFVKYAPGPMKNATSHYIEEMRQKHESNQRIAQELDKHNRGESPAIGFGALASDATSVPRPASANIVR